MGCARSDAPSRASGTSSSAANGPLPVALLAFWDGEGAASLAALDPHIQWWVRNSGDTMLVPAGAGASTDSASTGVPKWALVGGVAAQVPPFRVASLTTALKQLNFDASKLIAGALSSFSVGGQPYAVPVGVVPTGIACDTKAFQQAGVALPNAGWTLGDFVQTCSALQTPIHAGKVPGVIAVLPPLVGSSKLQMAGGGSATWYGALIDPSVWGAFVLGYGGTIVNADGQFDLTNSGAVQGLTELVALARSFGAPQQDVPASDTAPGVAPGAPFPSAMAFQRYNWSGTGPKTTHWVPLPALTVRSVVPVTPYGVQTYALDSGIRLPFEIQPPPNPNNVPLEALEATAAYGLWLNQLTLSDPSLPGLPPPVFTDAEVQNAYWTAGKIAIDWQNYVIVPANWPPTAPQGAAASGFYFTQADAIVFDALTQAVLQQTPIGGLLAASSKQLNAAAAASGSELSSAG